MNTEGAEEAPRGTEEVAIRAAGHGDLAAILRVEREAATAPHWPEEEYVRMVRGEGVVRRCLLVADAGEVVGFAVGMVAGEVGELESVAVKAGWRGRGLGAAVCGGVLRWCREEGAREVELEVREGSAGARRMYERLGFLEVGRRRGYYDAPPDDAVLMRVEFGRGT